MTGAVDKHSSLGVIFESKIQIVFLALGIISSYYVYLIISQFQRVREWLMQPAHAVPENGWPLWSDFYITAITGVLSYFGNMALNVFTVPFFERNCKEQANVSLRRAKALKAANNFYKGFYFIGTVSAGYYVLRNEPYLPTTLGGSGSLPLLYAEYPSQPEP